MNRRIRVSEKFRADREEEDWQWWRLWNWEKRREVESGEVSGGDTDSRIDSIQKIEKNINEAFSI